MRSLLVAFLVVLSIGASIQAEMSFFADFNEGFDADYALGSKLATVTHDDPDVYADIEIGPDGSGAFPGSSPNNKALHHDNGLAGSGNVAYRVQRREDVGAYGDNLVDDYASTSLDDSGLKAETLYWCRVYGIDGSENESSAVEFSIMTAEVE